MSERDVLEFLNPETSSKIAREFVDHLLRFVSNPDEAGSVDFDYDISGGKIKSRDTNTWISFNLDPDTEALAFIKAMYARELEGDEHQKIEAFINAIAQGIPVVYEEEVRKAVRAACLAGSDPKAIPLETIKITFIEMVDYSAFDDDALMKIHKEPGASTDIANVMKYLTNQAEEEGLSKFVIAEREIENGNELFSGITSIAPAEKYLWDVSMSMFVDYSLSDDFMEQVKEG